MVEPLRTLWQPGSLLLRRYLRGRNVSWLQACQVVSVDERGLLAWLPVGAGFAFRAAPDGSGLRAAPIEDWGVAKLVETTWADRDALILMPPGAAYSVWWFFRAGRFAGWYVNLEDRPTTATVGDQPVIDVVDHELDIVVDPDRRWEWKDAEELEVVTGQAGYWDSAKAAAIRAAGEAVVALIEAGSFPFDGTWCDFVPDSSALRPSLPADAGASLA